MRMTPPAWACLAVHLALAALPAHAVELLTAEGNVFRWGAPKAGHTQIITYATVKDRYLVPGGKTILSPDNCGSMLSFDEIVTQSPTITAQRATEQLKLAFKAWESVAEIEFVAIDDAGHANIVIGATDQPSGRAYANLSYRNVSGAQPVSKALGKTSNENTAPANPAIPETVAEIEQAYVCLNPRVPWKTSFDGDLQIYDLRYTFTHEIGHAIGLDHPGKTGSVMAYRYDESIGSLSPSDIAAVQSIYGPKRE